MLKTVFAALVAVGLLAASTPALADVNCDWGNDMTCVNHTGYVMVSCHTASGMVVRKMLPVASC